MPRWTSEARAKQAKLIKKWKPWTASTGPITEEGKAKASKNSLKHGARSKESIRAYKEINESLRQMQDALENLLMQNPE